MEENTNIRYCSFCGRPESDTLHILVGDNVCICEECANLAASIFSKRREEAEAEARHCCICGRHEADDVHLIKGKEGHICEDCVNLAKEAFNKQHEEEDAKEMKTIDELPKPKEIKAFMDDYVIGQDVAKQKIAVAIYNHYKRIFVKSENPDVDVQKSNILLCGPTGTGKTYMVQSVAKMLDVPFAIADATVFTEAGYVGEDVESILSRLLMAADYNVKKAERGIVFIDEIDKLARKSGNNPSLSKEVGNEGVQQGLLKLLEGSDVLVTKNGGRKHPEQPMIKINTKNILFICGGAFDGLDKYIERRANVHRIGFATENEAAKFDKKNPLKYLNTQDLKDYGMIPELLGRIPVVTYTEELDNDALKRILIEPKNAIIKQYTEIFKLDGIDLTFDDDVFDFIVEKVADFGLGARSLRGVMEQIMNDLMFELPSANVDKYNVTLEYAKSKF